MNNIMKVQKYALRKSYDLYFLGIILIALLIYNVESTYMEEVNENATAVDIFGIGGSLGLILMIGIVSTIVGQDFQDKTLNYDILAGYKRTDVFFGRFFVAMMYGCLVAILFYVIPGVVALFRLGWDVSIPAHYMVLRILFSIVVMIRVGTEVALFAVIFKSSYLTFGISLVIGFFEMMILNSIGEKHPMIPWLSSSHGVDLWYYFESVSRFGENGGINISFEAFPPMNIVVASLVTSVGMTALCIVLAVKIVNGRDMD